MCAIAAVHAFCGRHCGDSDFTDEERLIPETVQWSERVLAGILVWTLLPKGIFSNPRYLHVCLSPRLESKKACL